MPVLAPMFRIVLAICLLGSINLPARAHAGHDHVKPQPLALPVAPCVVAVTPDL